MPLVAPSDRLPLLDSRPFVVTSIAAAARKRSLTCASVPVRAQVAGMWSHWRLRGVAPVGSSGFRPVSWNVVVASRKRASSELWPEVKADREVSIVDS